MNSTRLTVASLKSAFFEALDLDTGIVVRPCNEQEFHGAVAAYIEHCTGCGIAARVPAQVTMHSWWVEFWRAEQKALLSQLEK